MVFTPKLKGLLGLSRKAAPVLEKTLTEAYRSNYHPNNINFYADEDLAISLMSDGNARANEVLKKIVGASHDLDRLGGLSVVQVLDKEGVYGSLILSLHEGLCSCDCEKTLAVLRALQEDMLPPDVFQRALMCPQEGFDAQKYVKEVKNRFGEGFGRDGLSTR